ncbi:MAG TPA: hypothetical protein VNY78_01925 [Edaphobacter sp.]|jgi:hypothetical protein|nr:hypothetical protein [Edaphobacter sp.]
MTILAAVAAGATMLQQVAERELTLSLVVHRLPFWFLVFALFLPRVALAVAWLQGVLLPFHLHGFLPLVVGIVLPRVLVLYLIYLDQGFTLWFIIHLVVAVAVWCGGGTQISRRRRSDVVV